MVFVIGYAIIIIIAVHSRIAFIQDGYGGACIIGLGRAGYVANS